MGSADRSRSPRLLAWAVLTGAVVWAAVALFVAPSLIRRAYEGRSLPFLDALIEGRGVHPVEHYLAVWRGLAVAISGALVALTAVGALMVWKQREIRAAAGSFIDQLPSLRGRDVLIIAVALGIVSGLAEASWGTFEYWGLRRGNREWIRLELFWMAPLAASVFLVALAALALPVRRSMGWGGRFHGFVVFLLLGLCLYGFGRTLRAGLHPAALIFLSAGLAAVLTRRIPLEAPAFLKWVRRSVLVGAPVLGLWAFLVARGTFEPRGTAGAAPAADAPNVLLIVWDTVRARSLSLYGYERETTPVLDSLSREAVVFDAAISAAPWTLPSHASLFTGRYHHELSVTRTTPLDDTYVTLAETLRERGYRTGGFVANTGWVGRKQGMARGFQVYRDQPPISPGAILASWHISAFAPRVFGLRSTRITADHVNDSFLSWVDAGADDGRPFFAFLNLFDAHEPYLPPGDVGFEFAEGVPLHTWPYWTAREYSPDELRELTDAYDSCIFYLDDRLGRLVEALRERGLLENTLLVLTADHGESLGEHQPDLLGHDNNIYYDVLHVPLVFLQPSRLAEGIHHAAPVSTIDIPATLFDMVARGSENPFPGWSLLPVLRGETPDSAVATRPLLSQADPADWHARNPTWPMSRGPLYSLVDGTTHYIVNGRGEEQIFDVRLDPWEHEDRMRAPRGALEAAKLREHLLTLMGPAAAFGPED